MIKSMMILFTTTTMLIAQSFSTRGQVVSWATVSVEDIDESQLGIRYLPEVYYGKARGERLFDADAAFNISANYDLRTNDPQADIDPYRLWVRYSSHQYELRAGLQKLNFGSATMLRPLMWFDKLDPRDPTQFTTGVYGVLFRYYFLNNANVWLWGLYGNSKTKGLEFTETAEDTPEFGGRVQYPLGTGELAFTIHHRQANFASLFDFELPAIVTDWNWPENRYALDGKWDMEIGVWFETVLIHTKNQSPFTTLVPMFGENFYQKYVNVGADYTLGIGNGLNVSAEYLWMDFSSELDKTMETNRMAALMTSYPLSLWDNLMAIWYVDIENQNFYQFYTWQRTYDKWSLNLSAYLNPESSILTELTGQEVTFGLGNGFQLMLVYNY